MLQKIQLQENLLWKYSDLEHRTFAPSSPKFIVSLHKAGLVDLGKSHLFSWGFMLHMLANNYMKHLFFYEIEFLCSSGLCNRHSFRPPTSLPNHDTETCYEL